MVGVCAVRGRAKPLSPVSRRRNASWEQHLTHTDTQDYKAKVSGSDNNIMIMYICMAHCSNINILRFICSLY